MKIGKFLLCATAFTSLPNFAHAAFTRVAPAEASVSGGVAAQEASSVAPQDSATESAAAVQSSGPGDIVVTAQRREQRLQDVGIAVTALGEAALANLGRQDISALAIQVPSLQTNQYSPTITVFNIRGVSQNDFADQQEAPIAFYNDEVYVGALGAISGQTFDLQRVEVLRGPQGTLFGRNATGGLVQIVSAKPTAVPAAYATVTVGSYNQIAFEGAVSGPITDWLRMRVSATSNYSEGFIKNRVGRDVGGSNFYGVRAQLEADVGAGGKLLLKFQGLRNDNEPSAGGYSHQALGVDADGLGYALPANVDFWGTGPGNDAFGYREPDNDPYTASFDQRTNFNRKYWTATARYTQELGAVTLTSITDYQNLKKAYVEDSDMSPSSIFTYSTRQNLYQFSQELRLSGDTDNLNWLVGGYFFRTRTNNQYIADLSDSIALSSIYGGRQFTASEAIFGQLEYKFSPLISLTVGGRYTWDRKDYNFRHDQTDFTTGDVSTFLFNRALNGDLARVKSNDYSGKVQVDIRPTDGVLVYASISRGTKGGGFNVQAFQPIDPTLLPFGQETLTSYEAGAKLTLLDGVAYLNGSVFHYDYNDYQAFTIQGLSQLVSNKPARIRGFEADINIRPATGLSVQAFVSHLDTKVSDIVLPSGRIVDRLMPQAPSWSFGGSLRYAAQIGNGEAAISTDWKYNTAQYLSTFNAPIDRQARYAIGNARLSYNIKPVEIAFFVNNVTDKQYKIFNLDLGSSLGIGQQTFARPRWFGGSVGYRF